MAVLLHTCTGEGHDENKETSLTGFSQALDPVSGQYSAPSQVAGGGTNSDTQMFTSLAQAAQDLYGWSRTSYELMRAGMSTSPPDDTRHRCKLGDTACAGPHL